MELSEKSVVRQGSICSPDPHDQLLRALRDRDLPTFQNILNQGVRDSYVDPNHWYDDPEYGTLLDIASKTRGNFSYVMALLSAGGDPNKINKVRKKAPLHIAIESQDYPSFEAILDDPRTDPNILDARGNPPLHAAAEQTNTDFLVKLINHPKINVNLANKKGQTALHVAAQQENAEAALALILKGIDVDSVKNAAGKTGRDLVKANLPELEKKLPSSEARVGNGVPTDLFGMLHRRDTETFLTAVRVQDKTSLDNHDGSHTYLQYACDFGLHRVVDTLLREGANPNATIAANPKTPIMLAAHRGYVHIVRQLMSNEATSYATVDGENVLHACIKGISEDQLPLGASKENRDLYKCLEILLQEVPRSKMDINCGDVKGNTPLHLAAKHGERKIISLLLRHGAYIGQRNALGQPAFADVNPKVMKSFLDECVTTNNKLPREDDYEIIFKYDFLAPPRTSHKKLSSSQVTLHIESGQDGYRSDVKASESDPLLYMSRSPDFRPLLKHPIFTSFIHLKWHKLKWYFFFNLTFYVIFWALLTGYILRIYSAQKGPSKMNGTEFKDIVAGGDLSQGFSELWRFAVLIFLLLLIVREAFQLAISPVRYIVSPENWLEIALIGVTVSIVFDTRVAQQQIAAVAILLSWGELILLIGRHPANSTNIEMLKTVSWNFLKFIAWYSILIIAFALVFYTLFRDAESEDNFFDDPAKSVFKTVVMLTGEFDAGSIPFVANPGVSHVLFVMFVFLVAIVLFNLLNGLAVSDTQAIREDAELVGYVSQVKLVSYIETMAFGDPFPFQALTDRLRALCCCFPEINCSTQFGCLGILSRNINLFSDIGPDNEIRVLPNQNNRIQSLGNGHKRKRREIEEEDFCRDRCCSITLDPSVVKSAREILNIRMEDGIFSESDDERDRILVEYGKRLDHYRDQLELLRKSSEKTQQMVQTLLDAFQAARPASTDPHRLLFDRFT